MFKKNVSYRIESYKYQLVMCQYGGNGYVSMKYYVAVYFDDSLVTNVYIDGVNTFGYFVKDDYGRWDFCDMEDFNRYFIVLDDCVGNKKVYNAIDWLRRVRNIKIIIEPIIIDDGYWYEYVVTILYPFNIMNVELKGYDNFILAAKDALIRVRKACISTHAKDGVGKWLEYIIPKEKSK